MNWIVPQKKFRFAFELARGDHVPCVHRKISSVISAE